MRTLIDRLRTDRTLSDDELTALLTLTDDAATDEYLQLSAQKVATEVFGKRIFIRGLIEITSFCRNNCYYCGLRRSNTALTRYRLTTEQILGCCREGYRAGFRTFVLQGGEDAALTDEWIASTVAAIRTEFPDCAITLSLGERNRNAYALFRSAGADRYLLRHETADAAHYAQLHPSQMSHANRCECLRTLQELSYQTGTGIMVGSPYQTTQHIVQDIRYIEQLRPQMIGIGPFMPHHATPFADYQSGSLRTTLRLLAIFRLMLPHALIPATTALASLDRSGRELGILHGANVVMPNLSPTAMRSQYSLYDNKAATGAEAAEGLQQLAAQLFAIGYSISYERGDYKD